MQEFKLEERFEINKVPIGEGAPAFIIAEIGINHNGDLNLAKEMIHAAKECGTSCVKFQSFRTEEFMGEDVFHEYMNNGKIVRESMYQMFKRLELPMAWHKELFEYALKHGVVPMTSVADPIIAAEVLKLSAEGIKLASEDLINIDLVDYVAAQDRPLILSTGMANQQEIADALSILKRHNHTKAAFLHCVSLYPTPREEANLRRIQALKNYVGGVVGYSDHTEGIEASVAAVAMGAKIIEKHFTIDKNLEGPDQYLSSDVKEFKELVRQIRDVEKLLGSSELNPSKTETSMARLNYRRSIVADADLAQGSLVSQEKIAYRRPGHGLKPIERSLILGKKLKRSLKRNEIISLQDVE
jgi:N,N'-diacetyllegionaminate synthase